MGNFFDGYTASALRSVLVVLFLLPVVLKAKSWIAIRWKRDWLYVVGMFVTSCFIWGPLYYAILHAGVGVSSAVNYATIVIGLFIFGWLWAGERFTKDKFLSSALGIIGLTLVFVHNTTSLVVIPLAAAALSGMASAANIVCTKLFPYNGTQSTIISWCMSILANAVMAVVFHQKIPAFGAHVEWLYLLFFSVASVIASWSLVRGSKLIDAGAAGILGLLEIVFGLLFGIVFFHERPGALVLIGAAIIIAAAAIPYFKDYNSKQGTLE